MYHPCTFTGLPCTTLPGFTKPYPALTWSPLPNQAYWPGKGGTKKGRGPKGPRTQGPFTWALGPLRACWFQPKPPIMAWASSWPSSGLGLTRLRAPFIPPLFPSILPLFRKTKMFSLATAELLSQSGQLLLSELQVWAPSASFGSLRVTKTQVTKSPSKPALGPEALWEPF